MRYRVVLFFTFLGVIALLKGQTIDEEGGIYSPVSTDAIVYFQVIPQNSTGDNQIDALFALSEGPVAGYSDCSTILRFNNTQTSPYLDVHDGGYTRTNNVEIFFNTVYHCWFVIHFAEQTYDTYVLTEAMESPVLIHEGAAFRKTNVSMLSYWSSVHYANATSNVLNVVNVGFVESVGDYSPDWTLISTAFGELDQDNIAITNIPPGTSISQFVAGLTHTESATIELVDESGNVIPLNSESEIVNGMTLRVVGIETSEYSLEVREMSSANLVLSAFNASISNSANTLSSLYNDLTLLQLQTGIRVSPYASFSVLNDSGEEITDSNTIIASGHQLEVTAEDGTTKRYTISTGSDMMPARTISNSITTYHQITMEKLDLEGTIEWHIKSRENPLPGSILNIRSEDAWLYFNHIKPQTFFDHYIDHIRINGEMPVLDENMRLVQYGNGCVVIGHSSAYIPLTIYADANLSGSSKELELHTYYKTSGLGEMADNTESFILKKGYMATFAENADGTGNSQVFIAHNEDIILNEMPEGLSNNISFVRVIPWRWTTKKSFADGSYEKNELLNSSWRYNWDNTAPSTLNIEYVPMRHNPGWNAYSNMVNKEGVTHALHFNEPNNPVDDGYATVEEAVAQWPNMLATGLRLGTPAPTDGGVGWLMDFVNACREKNYRIDFVAIHFYRGGQSTGAFYNFLKDIYDRTGLPIWVTEWNNGANWTCCKPSYEEQAETISDWVDMLEAAPFVERYALYGRVEDTRQMFYSGTLDLTPAGEVYRDKLSSLAYNPEGSEAKHFYPSKGAKEISLNTVLSWKPSATTTAQQLYFGKTYPPEFKAHLDGKTNSYDLGELEYSKTYYWRVDEYNGTTYVEGDSLEFATISLIKPYNPYPDPGATNVENEPTLSWYSDTFKSELHYLYFGEDASNLEFKALLPDTVTQFAVGKLNTNKTYYWRVDEHLKLKDGTEMVITGDTWSFATRAVTGLEEENSISIYPIPVKETLYIKGLKESEKVSVYNLLGAKVFEAQTTGTLQVGHLPKGIYLLKIAGCAPVKIVK